MCAKSDVGGDLVGPEKGCVTGIVTGLKHAACDAGLVEDDNPRATGVLQILINGKQPDDFHLKSGLLIAFPDSSRLRLLVVFDEAGGEAPLVLLWYDCTANQKDGTVLLNQHTSAYLRIQEVDKATVRAGLSCPSQHPARRHRRAAVGTKAKWLAIVRHLSSSSCNDGRHYTIRGKLFPTTVAEASG